MRALLLPGLFFLLVVSTLLAAGCGGGGDGGETLEIADIGWTENTAISVLTKVLLEEELGYEEVTVYTSDLDSVYEGVARGNLDAFQDVWLPNQQDLLSSVEDDIELLGTWYQGPTKQGIGVLSYMEATGLDQLTESEADLLLGIEPSSSSPGDSLRKGHPGLWPRPEASGGEHTRHARRGREPLRQPGGVRLRRLVAALDEPAVRLQISRGPKDAFGELNDPARILTIVNEGLPEDDPVAYAFMDALKLDEDQLNDLESTINEAGDPLEGGRRTNAASGSPGSRPPRTRASLEKGPAHYAKLRGNGECSVPAWHVTHLLVRERISAGGHRR